ncbi:hypothetical protein OZX62_08915 [Bifidobacterium sp. ESL0690]|uniref:hypothetical protein n=1 Tax=Bifidobacterium sp. ESL0690 TaxID=2983214 RepID=UPI0023F7C5D8|nr:hypothetical protein [Bifidobacterium sp. ESL0690]WEV46539.1 hypothetical protein OZX62_08915 [Bifidobacterium sp. ESL0690]
MNKTSGSRIAPSLNKVIDPNNLKDPEMRKAYEDAVKMVSGKHKLSALLFRKKNA